MIKAEQIPPDAMYAAWKAMNAGMTLNEAIADALNAWPGMEIETVFVEEDYLILPLRKENTND